MSKLDRYDGSPVIQGWIAFANETEPEEHEGPMEENSVIATAWTRDIHMSSLIWEHDVQN